MRIEIRTITVERQLSDYCVGCNYFTAETEEYMYCEEGVIKTKRLERCQNCNQCDSLYQRVMKNAKHQ